MRNFFHALEQSGTRYLLISGQAAVLYDASTFSEDVDIWVDPTQANWRRVLRALAAASANVYKLTPPLDVELARRGHGFHFTVPDDENSRMDGYLDIMGRPPRVPSFAVCARRARIFETGWGALPVISPADLVRVKRTRRLSDYAVISALVRRVVEEDRDSFSTWTWAMKQTFDAEDLLTLWHAAPRAWRERLRTTRASVRALRVLPPSGERLVELSALLGKEMERCRQADRRYWAPIIDELKVLQSGRELIRQGTPIAALL